MTARYRMFAAYNQWANARLYTVASQLPDADYRADRGAFFKSVHGTLNHLLVADRVLMGRFTGSGEAPSRLDAILHDDVASLWAARQTEDQRIIDYIEGLAPADLEKTFRYRTIVVPRLVEQVLAPALDHFFNHQTHHRGQLHCLITGITGDAPSLDLIQFQRETGVGNLRYLD